MNEQQLKQIMALADVMAEMAAKIRTEEATNEVANISDYRKGMAAAYVLAAEWVAGTIKRNES